jgi:outer membrane lipopolysaccharide assembly protein LptE/RlpB
MFGSLKYWVLLSTAVTLLSAVGYIEHLRSAKARAELEVAQLRSQLALRPLRRRIKIDDLKLRKLKEQHEKDYRAYLDSLTATIRQ